jgi:hypothetical protein
MGIVEREGNWDEFGYGRGSRPLPTLREWDAELTREVLRKAGCKEWSESEDGFVVGGGEGGAHFFVACTMDERSDVEEQLALYRTAFAGAGMRVEPDPDDAKGLLVWFPSAVA